MPIEDGGGGDDAGDYSPDVEENAKEKRQKRLELLYDMFEAVLFSIPDSQLPLAIALVINVATSGRCVLSQYHFDIASTLCYSPAPTSC